MKGRHLGEILDEVRYQRSPFIFGSVAKGTMREGSDIDLLIVKETKKPGLDRVDDVLEAVDIDIPLQPFVFTPNELQEKLRQKDPFMSNILETGKVLYERGSLT